MSTTSAAEEIDELRAKAIASMASASNPSTALRSKSPISIEEGEIHPSECAVETTSCSTVIPNATVLEEHRPNAAVDSHARAKQDFPTITSLPSSSPSRGNAQIRTSVKRNYSKYFKTVQGPLKSTSNRSFSWHVKDSDDNLVISFSDDDSGSNSEESKVEKNISRKDLVARGIRSEVPIASAAVPSRVLRPNRTNIALKKGLVHSASIPSDARASLTSSRHAAVSAEKAAHISRHNNDTNISARQELSLVLDPTVANHRLASGHEITLRENELKDPSKSMTQSNEKNSGPCNVSYGSHTMLPGTTAATIRRPASVAGIGLSPEEQIMKRLKPAVGCNNKHSSTGQLQLPIFSSKSDSQCSSQPVENSDSLHRGDTMDSHNDNIEKTQHAADTINPASSRPLQEVNDSGLSVPVHVTVCSAHVVSCKDQNHSKMVVDVSQSCDTLEKRNVPPSHLFIGGQLPCLSQSNPRIEGQLRESNVSLHKNMNEEPAWCSDMSRRVDSSSLLPSKVHGEHSITRTQQIAATADAHVPLETLSHFTESLSGRVPENSTCTADKTNLLKYSNQINISGEARMNLQSLVELEDLQDKELEDAQELRHMCELEERRALKAYRKAQRALVDANEKCSLLYRKRELFSAHLRALLMQASSSTLHSGWQSHGGTVSESIETVPHASFDLLSSLGHHLPVECQIFNQFGHEPNSRHMIDAQPGASSQQINAHDLVSAQCLEQYASTSDQRDITSLAGVSSPICLPNTATDEEENYPFEHRPAAYNLTLSIAGGNHGQTTADMNDREKLSSDENAQDYKLLEASLRSKLVERLGSRTSYTCNKNKISEAERLAQGGADKSGCTTKSHLPDQQMEGQQTESLEVEGFKRLGRSTNMCTTDNQSHGIGVSLTDEANRNRDSQDSSFFHTESCRPNQTTGSTLPSSALHVAFGHAKCALLGFLGELSTTRENNIKMHDEFNECILDGERSDPYSIARTGEIEPYSYDLAIDPFWPFCMFELRGKCNNEECRLQHVRRCTLRNLKHDGTPATSHSDGHASQLASARRFDYTSGPPYGLFYQSLSIPTYHIGLNLIKVDSHLSFSVLARSVWQYWQRGFCSSFHLPFSVQRILPQDAPFLQSGDGPVADDYNWNRLSLFRQTLDGSMNQHGLFESEQSLEMALDLFDGGFCKPDRKKALCMLSRAIEAEPSSVAVWVIYLHIYYARETNIGKDDLFFHAVNQNKSSYELWIMCINSRMQLGARLNAYERALTIFCSNENALEKDRGYVSACILDIFLQMIDFLCMSGNVEKAIQKIVGLSGNLGNTFLLDVLSCLTVSDRCIFWVCCTYLVIYRKLPELIVQKFEFEKELPFEIEWPSTHLTTDKKERALGLMKLAVDDMALAIDTNPLRRDHIAHRSLYFLAVNHIKCVGILEGLRCSADLLATYLSLYPTCIELTLMSARLKEDSTGDVVFKGFEESLSNWPKETSGSQCLWNQYLEHALADKRIDLAEIILDRWFTRFYEVTNLHDLNLQGRKDGSCDSLIPPSHLNTEGGTSSKQDDTFWFLNLSLYKMLQKNTREAQIAIEKALQLASPQVYIHCVQEHVALIFANESGSVGERAFGVNLGLLNGYLADSRSTTILEPLSRKYYRSIKRPRLRQLITKMLGPVSRDFTLVNSVLETCYGTSLLPEKLDDPKGLVDFVESLMEFAPANYRLALSVYKLTMNFCHPSFAANELQFWACSLLVNSIFQAVPVAPEHVWVEAANAMRDSEFLDITTRFHVQAVSVYPFSIQLWQSYLDICRNADNVDTIVETARERGIELNRPAD